MMPPPLSYPALKLVLEYLEAKKRYHVTSRNVGLQKIDHLIPLRVGTLTIWKDTSVSLDDSEYMTDYMNKNTNREVNKDFKIHKAKGKLMKKYLERRPNILVDRVEFNNLKFYKKAPVKLNLIINTLVTMGCSDFRNFFPMIDSRSFPLKKLEITQEKSINIDNTVVHTTEDVILQFNKPYELIKGIEKLHTKKLTIQNIMSKNVDAVKIIKDWMKNGRKIGTDYFLCFSFGVWIKGVLKDLKREFNEFQNDLEGINVRFLDREPRFLIPMSPTSKIIIYGTRILSSHGTVYQLVLKVVST
ncbi:hypothetical protein CRE_17874 [Caenorhabditis remanei]|uniref:F-box associated domain-containing protein n=1 Tax=Caenorhabditis remanei TaxID=31234 RepID=E3MDB9_CAERE|nr:hypothetical protein CRE_17874 [Caenorhabditis remanei]